MATWKAENSMLTLQGVEILNKLNLGQGHINISRIVAGSGRVSESVLYKQTTLSGSQKPLTIDGYNTEEVGTEISFHISNKGFTETFAVNQIGVFVTHPDYQGEILYHISQCDEVGADIIPADTGSALTLSYSLYLVHGNSSSITITIDPLGMVSIEQFEAFKTLAESTHTALNNSVTALTNTFNSFKSAIKAGKLITVDSNGNLIASGKNVVRGYPVIVKDAIAHRALSLSIEGKTTQESTPTVASPVYLTNTKVTHLRVSDGVNAAKFTSFPSAVELRSLGDYKDTIEWDGAKWWKVQRIQELVADGTNVTVYHAEGNSSQTYCRFAFNRGSYNIVKDHIASAPIITSHGNTVSNTAEFYAFHYSSSNAVCGHFLNTITGVLTTHTSAEKGTTINNWLKAQNAAGTPVKVYYVLKTPIVTEIPLTMVLKMIANHTELSCTVQGNTPSMVLGYALNTTDETTMYILKSLARKSDVQVANTFAVAEIIE